MRHGSLFSGIGASDLAAEWMEWTNVFHCENNPFCNQRLKKHFPHAESINDVRSLDGTKYRGRIDVLSGGFPCTQTSIAAAIHDRRTGLEGADSGLWYEYKRIIGEVRSTWVIVENPGGIKKWEKEIQDSLAAYGYTVSRLDYKASDFGLPHKRERLFYVANANGKRLEKRRQAGPPQVNWFQGLAAAGGAWLQSTPGTGRGINGLPNRVDRIKALGNSVPPQMPHDIFKLIQSTAP